jgi:hypothetical protein
MLGYLDARPLLLLQLLCIVHALVAMMLHAAQLSHGVSNRCQQRQSCRAACEHHVDESRRVGPRAALCHNEGMSLTASASAARQMRTAET